MKAKKIKGKVMHRQPVWVVMIGLRAGSGMPFVAYANVNGQCGLAVASAEKDARDMAAGPKLAPFWPSVRRAELVYTLPAKPAKKKAKRGVGK